MSAKITPCPPLPRGDLRHILEHTAPLWEEARGKSLFITGGTGFFGMWMLESFAHVNDTLHLGCKITVLTRHPERLAEKAPHLTRRPDFRFLQGDVRDFPLPEEPFDYVIHAAADVSRRSGEAGAMLLDDLVDGARRVLQLAAQCDVKKFLLVSSGAVYGAQPSGLSHLSEEYPGAPDPLLAGSDYGEGKRVSEHLAAVHARRHGYELKIARCFAFVGPHLPMDSVYAIGNFMQSALHGKTIRLTGDGSSVRSYLYAADLAIWLWTLLFKAPSHRAYNVGSVREVTIAGLAGLVKTTLQAPVDIETPAHEGVRPPASRYIPCTLRAARELGLHETTPLKEAILKTADWRQTAGF